MRDQTPKSKKDLNAVRFPQLTEVEIVVVQTPIGHENYDFAIY